MAGRGGSEPQCGERIQTSFNRWAEPSGISPISTTVLSEHLRELRCIRTSTSPIKIFPLTMRPSNTALESTLRVQASTNGVESFWAHLKRGYNGVYHQMSKKHLGRYIEEFEGRHNDRPKDTSEQMSLVVKGMESKRLKYRDLTAA